MILTRFLPCPIPQQPAWRFLLVAFALIWFTHCSFSSTVEKASRSIERTSKSVARQVTFSGSPYRHQVALGGFETIPQDPRNKIKLYFEQALPENISERCKSILMHAGGQPGAASLLTDPPRLANGEIDAYGLSFIGRQLGINAFIVGSLQSVRRVDELEGFLWNKETIHEVRVAVRFEVFQMLTATKILDSIYRRDVPVEDLSFDQGGASAEREMPNLDEALSDILDEAGRDICDALLSEEWNGFIASVEGEKISISAGSRAGLKPGVEMKVFDSTQTIEGVDGQRFFLMGDEVATIEIVSVADDRSEARQIDGGRIKLGHSVRPAD
jgi:hypothetical protein